MTYSNPAQSEPPPEEEGNEEGEETSPSHTK